MIDYKDLKKNRESLRARLMTVMMRNPLPISRMAKEMGIAPLTLQLFLEERQETESYTLFKILRFIVEQEKELGIETN